VIACLASFFTSATSSSTSPYLYLIAALALFSAGSGVGYGVRDVLADRDAALAVIAQTDAVAETQSKADAKFDGLQKQHNDLVAELDRVRDQAQVAADLAAGQLALQERQAHEKTSQLQKDITNAKALATAAGRRSCSLTNDWVRLYDAPLRALSAAVSATGGAADSSAGAAAARQLASGRDEWDVVELNAENARRWQSCRSQLNALIDLAHPAGTGQ